MLHEASARREGLLPVAVYTAAVSLDLLLAAILAERGEPQDHHDLGRMAARVGVGLAGERRAALGLFSDVLARLGRYRAPGGGGARDGSGEEVGTVRLLERPGADGRRPPSFADYLALWEPLEREYRPSDREAVRFGQLRSAPQAFEAAAGGAGVMDGVPGIAMAEVVLDEAQVVALVRPGRSRRSAAACAGGRAAARRARPRRRRGSSPPGG